MWRDTVFYEIIIKLNVAAGGLFPTLSGIPENGFASKLFAVKLG